MPPECRWRPNIHTAFLTGHPLASSEESTEEIAGNDAPTILGILFELNSLRRIDLVAEDTGDLHAYSPGG